MPTAVRRTFDDQKPVAVCMMWDGSRGVLMAAMPITSAAARAAPAPPALRPFRSGRSFA